MASIEYLAVVLGVMVMVEATTMVSACEGKAKDKECFPIKDEECFPISKLGLLVKDMKIKTLEEINLPLLPAPLSNLRLLTFSWVHP